ncbi:hypothetical protein DSO57_1010237 [Entomophthora muscae]|uniref:Uncharacterized protein n=1 Tax=Entomophthora muscae TaxID=34485 RepID=A0ACC2RXS1_9FUNG|nr:hypothetical protein DSO57_1010237 [Entomophthora muscae]
MGMEWERGSNLVQKIFLGLATPASKGDQLKAVVELTGLLVTNGTTLGAVLVFAMGVGRLLLHGVQSTFDLGLAMVLGLEAVFYLQCKFKSRKLFETKAGFPASEEMRKQLLDAALADKTIIDSIPGWFLDNECGPVTLGQARDWLAWYGFGHYLHDLDVSQRKELDARLEQLQRKHKIRFSDAVAQGQPMRLTLDNVFYQHKPLLLYGLVNFIQGTAALMLRGMGFHRFYAVRSSYWYLEKSSEQEPILFVHGIGIGLPMYLIMIQRLIAIHPNRSIVLLELPSISMVPTTKVHDAATATASIDVIVQRHRLAPFALVGHSYGTFMASWLLKNRPKFVARAMLIDPVCFALWEPTLIRSFIYRPGSGFVQRLVRYFVSGDLFVANSLARNFSWAENALLPQDISCPITVFLSRQDFIVDANVIQAYLTRCMAENPTLEISFILKSEYTHGSLLLDFQGYDNFLGDI